MFLPNSKKFELRHYQKAIVRETYEHLRKGKKRPLVYAPTGAGKTAIASKIMADAHSKGRFILFLVHRDSLIEQTQFALSIYGLKAGVIKAGIKPDPSAQIQIASIQSLGRRSLPEFKKALVICDEAHTLSFYAAFERIKELQNSILIGFTATPWRIKSENEFFGLHYDCLIEGPSIKELISWGYLTPPRYFGNGGLVDLAQIDNGSDGDFNQGQLQDAYLQSGVNEKIVSELIRLGKERKSIIFAAGIEQSKRLCELLNSSGIPAEHIDGETSFEERKRLYARLRSGQIKSLCNVQVLTEGFDEPSVDAIVLASATKSRAKLFQCCGRGLRLFQNKHDCLLLDFGSNFKRLGFLTSPQPITLEPLPKDRREAPLKECPDCGAQLYAFEMICPECGHEFPHKEEDNQQNFEASFGELFPPEVAEKIKYLRQTVRRLKRDKKLKKESRKLERAEELFVKRYKFIPPSDWWLGIFYGTQRTEANKQRYIDWLHDIYCDAKHRKELIEHWMMLEFGIPGKFYEGQNYKAPRTDYSQRIEWWEVLGVLPLAPWEEIKAAYRKLAREYHPDTSKFSLEEATAKMQILNWAFEKAKEARNE